MKTTTQIKHEISTMFDIAKKYIKVRDKYYAYQVEINKKMQGVIDLSKIQQYCAKFEDISRDKKTGEILSGGNTFVFVQFSC